MTNTPQNYGGRANNAQTNSQAVETRQIAPLTLDERSKWQMEFLSEVSDDYGRRESLFELLNDVRSLHETVDPIPALSLVLSDFLTRESRNADLHKHDVSTLIRLIGNLSRINASYYSFDLETDYTDAHIKATQKGGQINE